MAVAAALEETIVAAIARAEKSVVSISRVAHKAGDTVDIQPSFFGRSRLGGPSHPSDPDFVAASFATGVIVGRGQGRGQILTNHHALALEEKSDYYVTTASRHVYAATVKGAAPYGDLAVLEIRELPDSDDFVPITFGDSTKMRKGQIVIALGNPYAIARDGQVSASWGIIANMQRKSASLLGENGLPSKPTLQHFGSLIQTDAKLSLGTSGGALVNLKGEMIGLTTSLAAVAGYEQAAGYAIPVDDTFRDTVEKLKKGEERTHGLMGITFHRDEPRPIIGVRVETSHPSGPAHKAGIEPGDIIIRVDDRPIRDGDDLMLSIGRLPAGSPARITFERNGRILQRDVVLAKFPVQGKVVVTKSSPSWRGLTVDYATASPDYQARVHTGEAPQDPCVFVTAVADDSAAAEAGLRRGMLISQVGGQRVETPEEFQRAVAGKEGDVVLRLASGPSRDDAVTVSAAPKTAAPQ